jgi:chromosome segregation ATPase
MYRHDPADDRIRTARDAVAERDRLARTRDALLRDLEAAEQSCRVLVAQVDEERADVERAATFGAMFAMARGDTRLVREQRELEAVQAKRDEALARRDDLRARCTALDRQLAELAGVDAALADARAAKARAIASTPSGTQLATITEQLAANRARLPAFADAIAAGERARADLASLVAIMKQASTEVYRESPRYKQLTEAGARLTQVQAELDAFERALAVIEIPLEVRLATIPEHPTSWWDRIWTPAEQEHEIQMRVVTAFTAIQAVLARVDVLLLRARGLRSDLDRQNTDLAQMANQLVDPA